eukprot:COSAG02_NODE_82_length_39723_cov_247.146650_10_plen_95_part_00
MTVRRLGRCRAEHRLAERLGGGDGAAEAKQERYAPDHGRKGMMDQLIDIARSTARPELTIHRWAGEGGMDNGEEESKLKQAAGADANLGTKNVQ